MYLYYSILTRELFNAVKINPKISTVALFRCGFAIVALRTIFYNFFSNACLNGFQKRFLNFVRSFNNVFHLCFRNCGSCGAKYARMNYDPNELFDWDCFEIFYASRWPRVCWVEFFATIIKPKDTKRFFFSMEKYYELILLISVEHT